MIARQLPYDEWHKLEAFYMAQGRDEPMPRAGTAIVYVVEDDGRIIGSWPIHSIHIGGLMHVDKSRRGNGVAAMLSDAVETDFQQIGGSLFTAITNPHAEQLALADGMVALEGKLFRKDYGSNS